MSGTVQFVQLMQAFHDHIGLPHEDAEDGVYVFDIDGQQQLAIAYSTVEDLVVMQSDLRLPLPASQALALLQANAIGADQAAVVTAVTAGGTVALVRRIDMADLNVERLDGLLEDLVMRGDVWRERLAAAEGDTAPVASADAAPSFSTMHLRA